MWTKMLVFSIVLCWTIVVVCTAQERVTQTPDAEVVALRRELAELKTEMADLKTSLRDLKERSVAEIAEVKSTSLNMQRSSNVLRAMISEASTKATSLTEIAADARTKASRAEQVAKSARDLQRQTSANFNSQIQTVKQSISGLQRQSSANFNSQIQTVKQTISGIQTDVSTKFNTGGEERRIMIRHLEMLQKRVEKATWITLVYEEGMRISSSAAVFGRLEVYYNYEWGTVCHDGFNSKAARVACRQLGFSDYYTYKTVPAQYKGSGKIWLDNLYCYGTESTLQSCYGNGWSVHDCSHSQDIMVGCA